MTSSTRSLARRAALAATAVTAVLVLAACGSGEDSAGGARTSSPASAERAAGAHNDADVTFAQGMIPHHQQAVRMARSAATRASSAEVKDLASRIEKAQDPEIETMSGWLESWGAKVPSTMPGMDHSGHGDMPGMMDGQDMNELAKASGADFDRMFLTMMVEHHEGAVEMAATEKANGRYAPARKTADDIITAQNAEIEEMNKLLGKS
ncbi:DUF305 domain-containing protein [Streptomyces sp. NPDC056309]|uniref:DUF305 domain-containing protein n=1 Tax=unclassified Streptomyces TaxID=2593676 RepID=UPI0035D742D6